MREKNVIRITANFERNLEEIRRFLTENNAEQAFEALLNHLFATIVPNLERFPALGRDFLDKKPISIEGLTRWEALRNRMGEADLREYITSDYLILYAVGGEKIYLLAIKHHRQLSFDLAGFWK